MSNAGPFKNIARRLCRTMFSGKRESETPISAKIHGIMKIMEIMKMQCRALQKHSQNAVQNKVFRENANSGPR